MVEIETECYYKDSEDNVIGVQVTVYDGDDEIDSITITNPQDIDDLKYQVAHLGDTFIDNDELFNILKNTSQGTVINATKLNGLASDKFLKVADIDSYSYKPKTHASQNNDYGWGTSTEYGHNKIIDNLTRERFVNGESLAAHQGYVLNQRITNLENEFSKNDVRILISRKSDGAGETGTQIIVNYGSNGIVGRIESEDPNFNVANRTIRFWINGQIYDRETGANGKAPAVDFHTLPVGKYLITALMAGVDGKNPVSEQKFIIVQ